MRLRHKPASMDSYSWTAGHFAFPWQTMPIVQRLVVLMLGIGCKTFRPNAFDAAKLDIAKPTVPTKHWPSRVHFVPKPITKCEPVPSRRSVLTAECRDTSRENVARREECHRDEFVPSVFSRDTARHNADEVGVEPTLLHPVRQPFACPVVKLDIACVKI